MKPKSTSSVPPADSDGGVGPEKNDNLNKAWTSMTREGNDAVREGSPSIKLGLGIGGGSGGLSHVIKQGKPAFTPVQFQELRLQSLIFRYIVAGLPVPVSLVLPIWKSFANHFGYADGGIYDQFPSFLGFGSHGFNYKSRMDPEPGRCKRTDGKKWRCSWNVVPDQKYCERHMHRGRQRSRKHVETLEFASEPDKSTAINSSNVDKTNNNHSIPVPVNLQLTTSSPDIGNNTPTATITTISGMNASKCNVNINERTGSSTSITLHANNETKYEVDVNKDAATGTANNSNAAGNNSNSNGCGGNKDQSCKHIIDNNNINRCSNYRNNGKSGGNVSLGFGFSPRSVLQGGIIISCSNPCFDYRDAKKLELQRCRRTDGKKWQCSRDAIPGQKYCGRHMHRGAKKLFLDPHQVTVASAIPSNISHPTPLAVPKRAGDYINLNTNLSISIPASPLPMINVEARSNSGSSSDATTISDEFSSASHRMMLSP